jgi:hypothetical protein
MSPTPGQLREVVDALLAGGMTLDRACQLIMSVANMDADELGELLTQANVEAFTETKPSRLAELLAKR